MKKGDEKLPQVATSVRVIAGEIWCCCGDADIAVYDEDLKWKRSIQLMGEDAEDNNVYDVAVMPHGELIIARAKGLYHTDMTGKAT